MEKQFSISKIPIMRHPKTEGHLASFDEVGLALKAIKEYQEEGNPIEIIVSSPASRCLQIARNINIPLMIIPELAPIHTLQLPSIFKGKLYRVFRESCFINQVVFRMWVRNLIPFSESPEKYLARSNNALLIISKLENPFIIAHAETVISFFAIKNNISITEAAKIMKVPHNKIIEI